MIIIPLASSLTVVDLPKLENMLFGCIETSEFKPVKLKTKSTVILPQELLLTR